MQLQRAGVLSDVISPHSCLSLLTPGKKGDIVGSATTIVELGPGNGDSTQAILRAAPVHARLLSIEISPRLHALAFQHSADARVPVGEEEHSPS